MTEPQIDCPLDAPKTYRTFAAAVLRELANEEFDCRACLLARANELDPEGATDD